MKAKRYVFLINENREVISFCGLVKKKIWPRRDLAVPYLFWHLHLVKEVRLPEDATAIHAGVFNELTALDDIYIPNNITLLEGCLPDHKVTIHASCSKECYKTLMEYDWNADDPAGTGFSSILWHAKQGLARLRLTLETDCVDAPEFHWPLGIDITIDGKTKLLHEGEKQQNSKTCECDFN